MTREERRRWARARLVALLDDVEKTAATLDDTNRDGYALLADFFGSAFTTTISDTVSPRWIAASRCA